MDPRAWIEAYFRAWAQRDADAGAATVEWWATFHDEGEPVTLPGCLVLRFGADGLCEELREYWHVETGTFDAPAG